jgi:ribosomal protein L11 methyltransferase
MHKVRLKLPNQLDEEAACQLTEGLVNFALSSSTMREENKQSAPWVIEWLLIDKPEPPDIIARLSLQGAAYNINAVADITPEQLEIEEISDDTNWLEESYQGFVPFTIGSFFIHGSNYEGDVPEQQTPLKLDAATAFGSGEHETTKGCMLAMLDLKAKGVCPWNILDMGTGSGILALIAWKLWKSPIMAVDNQAESIRVTDHHAQMNGVKLSASCLSTAIGDGFNTPQVNKNKPYELILANILAGPVIEMAPSLIDVLDDNGYCVLSGMLIQQSDLVLSAYEGEGLTYRTRYDIGEWTTLVMQKI